MKKILYIIVPIIALSLVASDAWSAKAPQPGAGVTPSEFRAGRSGAIPLGSGKMGARRAPGGKGSNLGIPRGRWWKRPDVQESLKLTDEQIAKLEKISIEGRKNMIRQRAELEIIELELEPLMEAKKFDREKVESVLDKMEGIRAKMAKERIKSLLDTREVLTSEQFQKLKEIKHRRGGREKLGRGIGQKGSRGPAQRPTGPAR